MAFESTITEKDMDPATQALAQAVRGDNADFDPDHAGDVCSYARLAKLLRLCRLA